MEGIYLALATGLLMVETGLGSRLSGGELPELAPWIAGQKKIGAGSSGQRGLSFPNFMCQNSLVLYLPW